MNQVTVLPNDVLLVGFDLTHGDNNRILIVGRKAYNEQIEIVNAFEGDKAYDIYKLLTTVTSTNVEDDKNV